MVVGVGNRLLDMPAWSLSLCEVGCKKNRNLILVDGVCYHDHRQL